MNSRCDKMGWKIIIGLCATFIVIFMLHRIDNHHDFKFYFNTYINAKSNDQNGLKKLFFHNYLARFNKTYGRDELPMRFALFKENLKKIRVLNRGRGLERPTFGLTKFSDWTKEELDSILTHPQFGEGCETLNFTCHKDYSQQESLLRSRQGGTILPALDWREREKVGLIQNQRRCNACWAFSIVGVMESMYAIKDGFFTSLSIQEVIDCSYHSHQTGCLHGRPMQEALEFICNSEMEIATEKEYPLTLAVKPLSDCSAVPAVTRKMKKLVNSCEMHKNETKLLEVLNYGPVTALVNGGYFFNYDHGIIDVNCESSVDQLSHAVQIVGYNTTAPIPYYIIRNSWDTDWGEKGYARLKIGGNQCGIAYSIGYFEVY